MRKMISLFLLFMLALTGPSISKAQKIRTNSDNNQSIYCDEQGYYYTTHKTRHYKYKYPKQEKYYTQVWWNTYEGCYYNYPCWRYYRNGWPYYWFY